MAVFILLCLVIHTKATERRLIYLSRTIILVMIIFTEFYLHKGLQMSGPTIVGRIQIQWCPPDDTAPKYTVPRLLTDMPAKDCG